ncbi:hypothetical protein [Micromonospora wenchangensis]|uniref:hypothetical protein n=1 Tax=Micromonospora wenchangensis TaxID=1185415 RepID=UPI003D730285
MRAGDLVYVTSAASVQFLRPIRLRVIRVLDWPTYDGWVWLEGYQLDAAGDAVSRRKVFVRPAGLTAPPEPAPAQPGRRRTTARVRR